MVFLKGCEMSLRSLNFCVCSIPSHLLSCLVLGKGSLTEVLRTALQGSGNAVVKIKWPV